MGERLQRYGIEYNLTEHCNLSCYACNHACALLPIGFASVGQFERDLVTLEPILHAQELRIGGGEPLLHPRLLDFLRIGRRIGIADSIVLYTNGVLLHRAPAEMWKLIDDLWLSIYPGIPRVISTEGAELLCRSHGVRFRPQRVTAFTLTLLNDPIDDPDLVRAIWRECDLAHAWSCHAIHEGRYYKCAQAPFFEPRLRQIGIEEENRSVDGVALHDNPRLREDLEAYFADDRPLHACTYCLGTSGPRLPHRVLHAGEREAWLRERHHDAIALVREKLLAASPDRA